jgi:hypothetical protein
MKSTTRELTAQSRARLLTTTAAAAAAAGEWYKAFFTEPGMFGFDG